MTFTDIQQDLLKESFNIGIGVAAKALSEIAGGQEIFLTVPEVDWLSLEELSQKVTESSGTELCGVSERFYGTFSGRAMMLYSQKESLELVKIMLGGMIPIEELSEMEGEALCEVGNIVLNASIATFADLLKTEIHTDVPKISLGRCEDILKDLSHDNQQVLYLKMKFCLSEDNLSGHLTFLFNFKSANKLISVLENYLNKVLHS